MTNNALVKKKIDKDTGGSANCVCGKGETQVIWDIHPQQWSMQRIGNLQWGCLPKPTALVFIPRRSRVCLECPIDQTIDFALEVHLPQ